MVGERLAEPDALETNLNATIRRNGGDTVSSSSYREEPAQIAEQGPHGEHQPGCPALTIRKGLVQLKVEPAKCWCEPSAWLNVCSCETTLTRVVTIHARLSAAVTSSSHSKRRDDRGRDPAGLVCGPPAQLAPSRGSTDGARQSTEPRPLIPAAQPDTLTEWRVRRDSVRSNRNRREQRRDPIGRPPQNPRT